MSEKWIPISEVEPTYDPNKIVKLINPFTTIFRHDFNGKPVKVPKGLTDFTEPMAHFLAKHMAEQEMIEPKTKAELEARRKPFSERSWEEIQELSKGLKPEDVVARAEELVLDPSIKKDRDRIKELQAA